MTTTLTTTYRAAAWISSDCQATVRLTRPEHSSLPDSELLTEAHAEAQRLSLEPAGGYIYICAWKE